MKTFLALLISCLTLSAATTYPVLTDSTNRLFPGGVTNVFFLNSNIVTTGTMRATGAVTLTNASNIFAGDGSGLTGAGIPSTGGSATNFQIYSSGTTNQPLRVWLGTQTNSNPLEISGIWNNAAVDFTGLKVNVTNTASGTWSALLDLRLDGASKFNVGASSGTIYGAGGAVSRVFQYGSGATHIDLACHHVGLLGFLSGQTSVAYGFGDAAKGSLEGLWVRNEGRFGWYGFDNSATDIAFMRASSGLVEVTTGTTGTYRDLLARSLYATNLYATNLIINGGATVTKILSATATLNFDLTALTVEDLTITVTGAADGDVVTLGIPNGSVTTSIQYSAWVSAADTVTVRARTSAIGENPASGTFRATVIKH